MHGNFYGTSLAGVEAVRGAGKICVLDIDAQVRLTSLEVSMIPSPRDGVTEPN